MEDQSDYLGSTSVETPSPAHRFSVVVHSMRIKEDKKRNINPWKTLSTELKYDNPWIRVSESKVIHSNGGDGIYGLVHFKNVAVGILPLDWENNTYLVGQYRYALNEYSWEIPEGGSPSGETILETAKRELEEETGLIAKEWKAILKMHTSNSVTDEVGYAFVARGLSQGQAQPENTEDLEIWKVPFEQAFEMTMDGRITDSLSVVAILKVKLLISRGKL